MRPNLRVQLAIEKELSVDNNEYKVITSNTPIFHNSARLKQILAEEAPAGWDGNPPIFHRA